MAQKFHMHKQNTQSRLRAWLNNIPIQHPVNRQMAVLLQVVLIGLMAIIIIATIINLFLTVDTISWQAVIMRGGIVILIIGIPLFLVRRGYLRGSVLVIIGLLLAAETFAVVSAPLRAIAETLSFFTLAIILAGLLAGRTTLLLTFAFSAGASLLGVFREQDAALKLDSIVIAGNFILINGVMTLFLYRFGLTLRNALTSAWEREEELKNEINIRRQTETALRQSSVRLGILHEIDRSLLSARALPEIALDALIQIRQLIPCPRASVSLFDLDKKEASFLTADFDEKVAIPDTPISFKEFGQRVIDTLLENKPWFSEDIHSDPQVTELDLRLSREANVQAWLTVPLMVRGQLIGALNLGRRAGNPFTNEDAEIAIDIANQLAIALQQAKLYDALQMELAERKKLISQLEASNAELERFTYTVSHDLRNPLVTIKGFLGMLEKDLREGRRDRISGDFQRISNAADKMHILLTDLLELSRIGRIINPPEEVDLVQLTREALETLDAQIRSRSARVNVSPNLPIVHGDRTRLREVLENLIDNAIKYTGDRSDPVIEIGAQNREGEQVVFVKDNGMGIDPKYHAKIFGLFEKLNPAIEGTGIGLALIKRIIETHGGRIWVESDGVGKGSMFCFTIPNNGKK